MAKKEHEVTMAEETSKPSLLHQSKINVAKRIQERLSDPQASIQMRPRSSTDALQLFLRQTSPFTENRAIRFCRIWARVRTCDETRRRMIKIVVQNLQTLSLCLGQTSLVKKNDLIAEVRPCIHAGLPLSCALKDCLYLGRGRFPRALVAKCLQEWKVFPAEEETRRIRSIQILHHQVEA
eukprot:scaffold7079_cov154-Pinguiococcus_pyrenoidosus.AAC.3